MVRVGPCLDILESVTGLCPLAVNTRHPQGEPSLDAPPPPPNPIYSILWAVLDVTKTQMFNNMCF